MWRKAIIMDYKFLTVKEVSEILRIGKTMTYELVNQPDFPKLRIGKKILIPEKEFQDFLKRYLYKKYTLY